MPDNEKLSAAQRSRVRRLSLGRELAPDEEGGELNIVPFLDIITNVMMFVLATVAVTFMATIDSNPPRRGGRGSPTQGSLNLTTPGVATTRARVSRSQRRARTTTSRRSTAASRS